MKRIGFGRIAQETNSYSALPTVLADFRAFHWLEGDELMAACERGGDEAPGFKLDAELSGFVKGARAAGGDGIELVPLVSAWAIPGGPLTAECLAELRSAMVESLRDAGPLDGLMLSMHGAMGAFGSEDPEADLVEAVRAVIGPDVPIAVSLDLHAQVGPRFMDATDIVCAYRTNPHRDHKTVGRRAGDLLVRTVLGDVSPTTAWRTLPMVLGGGLTLDFLKPMRAIYGWMKRMERDPDVLYVSLFNAHLWNDSQDLGWSSVVVTDGKQDKAERLAEELADQLWSVRHDPIVELPGPQEAIDRVRKAWFRRKLGVACLCDASDVVGAGAPGENTRLLRALLDDAKDLVSLVPIRDPAAVEACWDVGPGGVVSVDVGGTYDDDDPALRIDGTLIARMQLGTLGRAVSVDLGQVKLVITEGPALAMKPEFYSHLGLDVWRADIAVVKSFFPFRWYFLPMNRLTIYVRTKGVTDFDVGLGTEFRLPVHPKQELEDWRPADRERRGLQ